ncbi:MAG TPA: SDR family oxidoreductase [Acidobacteriota bacterium]|jgi:3-oxoacyl-[acyl-carrier protein] reductase|nr:SDR family oxidoreductase [Acidobacteriota bacterium]HNT17237.1 SDR family oxidoreductase [Acidobacteriota bacterium]HPA26583.1 SDR family oxidoreductase [Acidobacteriota bacterium]HQO20215.1 SDR family oxidoreductase [Acidobacteriota bacterium]HQQ46942.1 SDR family oxidoreductase [Acidobacteriota bacterium]
MDLGLRGKRAFVAGSSKGIGYASAESLAREGADLFLVARNGELLEKRAEDLGSRYGVKASFHNCDLTKEDEIDAAVMNTVKTFGGIDILIANCGGPKAGGALEVMDEESLDGGFRQTFLSTVRLVRAFLPSMREKKWGRIVAITSVSVFEPIENLALSNTFRAGLTGFLKTLSNEVAKEGITVNSICPGYTRTERHLELSSALAAKRSVTPEKVREEWEASIPMRRMAQPEEIAAATAFLCSEQASYITGVSLPVDGGRLRGVLA